MSPPSDATPPDAVAAAWLCAVDPAGLGGILVRARAGLLRDRWLAFFRALLPAGMPVRRLPLHADETRVFGGLDFGATLAAGRPVAERGIMAEADGGLVLLSMAERVPVATAARLGAILDSGSLILQRDGLTSRYAAQVGVVALDEGANDDERVAGPLLDRLAFWIGLDGFHPGAEPDGAAMVAAARTLYPGVSIDDAMLRVLCGTAMALGVASMRASVLALRAARAAAALGGRLVIAEEDVALAARLVFGPRATQIPQSASENAEPSDGNKDDRSPPPERDGPSTEAQAEDAVGDLVTAAARAAIPSGLLERLQAAAARTARQTPGRAGAVQASAKRGRPAGTRRGSPGAGARLDVIATLRAAAPWQRLRVRPGASPGRRIEIRRDDLRITRFKQPTETTTVFVVDASGSLAANRLAEAKGAVELLLAECYVRRDQVALLAFRGKGVDLLLPPTRSLARAKRSLADLPGGGGTPLAGAIDAAVALADSIRRRGQTPVLVFLTDGRANVARDGTAGRGRAEADAQDAARAAAAAGLRILLVDAAPRPQPPARALAAGLGALYIPLPRAEANALSQAIRAAP